MAGFDVPSDAALAAEALIGDGVQMSSLEQNAPGTVEAPAVAATTTDTSDWQLDGVDVSKLKGVLSPSELEALKANTLRQADYTRKTQEVAEQRKALGDLDPVQARQAVEFVQRFEQDEDFQQEVVSFLAEQRKQGATVQDNADTLESSGVNPELAKKISELEAKINARDEADQAKVLEMQWEQYIQEGRSKVLELHPTYTEQEMEKVFRFAQQHDYDLVKGAEDYEAFRQEAVNDWAKKKDGVSGHLAPQGGVIPCGEKKLTWDNAEAAALEYARTSG